MYNKLKFMYESVKQFIYDMRNPDTISLLKPPHTKYYDLSEEELLERSRIMYPHINATLHKDFVIPITNLSTEQLQEEIASMICDYTMTEEEQKVLNEEISKSDAEQKMRILISDYKENVFFDDENTNDENTNTNDIYIYDFKEIPNQDDITYRKEYWFPTPHNKDIPNIETISEEYTEAQKILSVYRENLENND